MYRLGSALLLWALLSLVLTGCGGKGNGKEEGEKPAPVGGDKEKDKGPTGPTKKYEFSFTLPASEAAPTYAKERVSKLTIDGRDHSEPRADKRTVKAAIPAAKTKVKVEFSFWPNTYTNIVRGREVALVEGKAIAVDFTKKEKTDSELIKPIYVPTPNAVVEEMCKLAKVGKGDVVYDVGCGDGRMVIMAVKKFGAKKGVGIDIREELVKKCKDNAKTEGVDDRTEFRAADATKIEDFSEASVVLLYLGDYLNLALRPTLQKTLKPGARVVSHRFLMGDWKPDRTVGLKAKNLSELPEEYKLHLWTIKKP